MSGEHGFPLKLISSLLSMLVDLLYRLGKLAEASQKSKMKSTCKYFPCSCFSCTCFRAVLSLSVK